MIGARVEMRGAAVFSLLFLTALPQESQMFLYTSLLIFKGTQA